MIKLIGFEIHFSNEKKNRKICFYKDKKKKEVILNKFLFINLWYLWGCSLSFKLFLKITKLINSNILSFFFFFNLEFIYLVKQIHKIMIICKEKTREVIQNEFKFMIF